MTTFVCNFAIMSLNLHDFPLFAHPSKPSSIGQCQDLPGTRTVLHALQPQATLTHLTHWNQHSFSKHFSFAHRSSMVPASPSLSQSGRKNPPAALDIARCIATHKLGSGKTRIRWCRTSHARCDIGSTRSLARTDSAHPTVPSRSKHSKSAL